MRIVKCPTCSKDVEWSPNNPYRPFCSERCKLIDLGAWADGTNAISTPLTEKDLDDPQVQAQIAEAIESGKLSINEEENE
ncbi:MAG: DNA gyrase inhibitor YacG [Succinivibrionaceae bacterium]|nr:DNA gyrase inhibitor YacG [Succinivibrionaceae bacterium]